MANQVLSPTGFEYLHLLCFLSYSAFLLICWTKVGKNENKIKGKTTKNPPNKQVPDPPIRQSSDTIFSCMSDFSCCYLSRQFGFCFTEVTRVLLAGGMGKESNPLNTQAVNTNGLARKKTVSEMVSEKCWQYAFMLKNN